MTFATFEASYRQPAGPGGKVLVDNTTATCLGQHPLELGADLSVASGTKMLTGHADLLLGYVATRDSKIAAKIRKWRSLHGAILGPWEAWLAHRSLATAHLRLERQCSNALELARVLLQQPGVRNVRHPGLPTDPAYKIAASQMDYFGPVVSFELPDRKSAERFLGSCQLIFEATSFGGIHTTAERRARWGGDQIPQMCAEQGPAGRGSEDFLGIPVMLHYPSGWIYPQDQSPHGGMGQ